MDEEFLSLAELAIEEGQDQTYGQTMFNDFDMSGFWRGENAMPGPVRLVEGDIEQFHNDLEDCKRRTRDRLDKMQHNRFMINSSWPEELIQVDKWCDASVSYNKREKQ